MLTLTISLGKSTRTIYQTNRKPSIPSLQSNLSSRHHYLILQIQKLNLQQLVLILIIILQALIGLKANESLTSRSVMTNLIRFLQVRDFNMMMWKHILFEQTQADWLSDLFRKEVENQILSWASEKDPVLKKKIHVQRLKKSSLRIEECLILKASQRDRKKSFEKNVKNHLKSIVLIAIKKQSWIHQILEQRTNQSTTEKSFMFRRWDKLHWFI